MYPRRNPYEMLEDVVDALDELSYDLQNVRDIHSPSIISSLTNMQNLLTELKSKLTGEISSVEVVDVGVLGSDIPLESLQQSFDFVSNNEPLRTNLGFAGSSLLAFAMYICLEPIVEKMFRYFKGRCKAEDRKLNDEEADLLELAINLRNMIASQEWTLEIPNEGTQILPNQFDEITGKRTGSISEVLMPRIPERSNLRGLVRV